MIYGLAAAGLALVVVALFAHSLYRTIAGIVVSDRERHGREHTLHHEQTRRLVDDIAAERRDWTEERSILLTRIQDPGAAVAMTMATLPPPVDLDVDLTR